MKATKKFLKRESQSAIVICGQRKNMCDVVCNELSFNLSYEFDIDSYAPIYAPVNGKKHFICLIPAEQTNFTNKDGYVIIDPTIKQFNSKKYPDIAILPPKDNRWNWYDSIEIPTE